jgi:hypothetical protein
VIVPDGEGHVPGGETPLPFLCERPDRLGGHPQIGSVEPPAEPTGSVEANVTDTARPQQEEEEVGVAAEVELLTHLTEIGGSTLLEHPPVRLVFPDQPIGLVLDDLPECDQGLVAIADLVPPDLDVAAQEFVEDGASPEERLIVGGDATGELGNDLPGLSPLAAR